MGPARHRQRSTALHRRSARVSRFPSCERATSVALMQDGKLSSLLSSPLSQAPVSLQHNSILCHFPMKHMRHSPLSMRLQRNGTSCIHAVADRKADFKVPKKKTAFSEPRGTHCRSESRWLRWRTAVCARKRRVWDECWRELPDPDLTRDGRKAAKFCQLLTSSM